MRRNRNTLLAHPTLWRRLLELVAVLGLAGGAQGAWAGAAGTEIAFVPVGDPGNAGWVYSGVNASGQYNLLMGAVAYPFRIGKYEVTCEQYLEFLNAVDPQGVKSARLLFKDFVLDPARPSGQRYLRVVATANLPVECSWYAAARFCNWLHHGKGGPGTEEGTSATGAYNTLLFDDGDATNDPAGHHPGARYWIPTEDEWVKAAHYKGGRITAGYWNYPCQSDTAPRSEAPPGGVNSANCADAGFYIGKQPVGSYSQARSAYGLHDLAGNVNDWTESWFEGDIWNPWDGRRMVRGGQAIWQADHSAIWYRMGTHRKLPFDARAGFRVARPANLAPVALASSLTTTEDSPCAALLLGSDPDGDPLSFLVMSGPSHGTLGGSPPSLTYRPAADFTGTDTFTFQVSDGQLASAGATVTIMVSPLNDPPRIDSAPAAAPNPALSGQAVTFSAAASDVDGDALTYAWSFGDGTAGSGSATAHAYAGPGVYLATLLVSDGLGGSAGGQVAVTVNPANQPPSMASAPKASPNPVTGTAANLTVLGTDDGGEAGLTYTWSVVGVPPAPVTFSVNGTNGAKSSVVTFSKAGSYSFQVTLKDSSGLSATGGVLATVNQTLTTIQVTPGSAIVSSGGTLQFTAVAKDQFGAALGSQPPFVWTVGNGSMVGATGFFTKGPTTVRASAGGKSGTANVTP